MAENISEKIADRLTIRAVQLLKLSASMQATLRKSLKALEQELVAKIDKIDVTGVKATAYQQARLAALLKQTKQLIDSTYKKQIAVDFQNELREVAGEESRFILDAINKSVGVDLATVALSPETIREIAKNTLIQGAQSSQWWAQQGPRLQQRFAAQIRQGMLSGETIDQLIRRVRGTAARGFKDGIMQAARHEAEALVRTSVMQVSNEAYRAMYKGNGDIVKGYAQLSTLDSRTTVICISYSGKSWKLDGTPIGHKLPFKRGPPRHWSCRSVMIPILRSWQALSRTDAIRTGTETGGGRPTSITRFFNQRLKAKGFSDLEIDQIKMDTRASMDGQVAGDISFDSWLKKKEKQSPGFAAGLLGKGKADLWRRGKITLEELIDFRGNPLTLEELRVK